MSDPGHVDTWGAPRDGWPEFCDCGKRKQDGLCWSCDFDQVLRTCDYYRGVGLCSFGSDEPACITQGTPE